MKNFKKITIGEIYKVKNILGENNFKKYLNSLGIIKNSKIKIYKEAPLGDPIIIQINQSTIALRKKIFENLVLEKI